MIVIRQELPDDYEEVYELVKKAFSTANHSDGTEADYLNELRTKKTFIPELSFIAETKEKKITGQIVLYQTFIETTDGVVEALVLSPLSVHPDYFRQGIARTLVEHALKMAAEKGYIAVFLCGEPEIYQKMGFCPSYEFDVWHKDDPSASWCMGREIIPGSLENISGKIDII